MSFSSTRRPHTASRRPAAPDQGPRPAATSCLACRNQGCPMDKPHDLGPWIEPRNPGTHDAYDTSPFATPALTSHIQLLLRLLRTTRKQRLRRLQSYPHLHRNCLSRRPCAHTEGLFSADGEYNTRRLALGGLPGRYALTLSIL